jgi:predicted kinase
MLIILRGVSGSGKSRLLSNVDDSMVLSSDKFRKMVWGHDTNQKSSQEAFSLLKKVLDSRLSKRLPTIIDSTALRYKDVKSYIQMANACNVDHQVLSINCDLETAYSNVLKRVQHGGLYVPKSVIEKQLALYESQKASFEKYTNFTEFDELTYDYMWNLIKVDREKLFVNIKIEDNQPVYVIGDIHGCHQELQRLIDNIYSKHKNALIFSVGDVIDRGEDSFRCFDILAANGVRTVLGNHEKAFLFETQNPDRGCRSAARTITHEKFKYLSKSDKRKYLNIMKNMPVVYILDINDKPVIISHGGLSSSCVSMLLYNFIPMINVYDCIGGCEPFTFDQNDDTILQIHGHRSWEFEGIEKELDKNIVNIDSHCYNGEYLTAIYLNDKTFLQVKAKKVYWKFKKRG